MQKEPENPQIPVDTSRILRRNKAGNLYYVDNSDVLRSEEIKAFVAARKLPAEDPIKHSSATC